MATEASCAAAAIAESMVELVVEVLLEELSFILASAAFRKGFSSGNAAEASAK